MSHVVVTQKLQGGRSDFPNKGPPIPMCILNPVSGNLIRNALRAVQRNEGTTSFKLSSQGPCTVPHELTNIISDT